MACIKMICAQSGTFAGFVPHPIGLLSVLVIHITKEHDETYIALQNVSLTFLFFIRKELPAFKCLHAHNTNCCGA